MIANDRQYRITTAAARQFEEALARLDERGERRHGLGHRRLRRPVQHDAHGALVAVLGDEHHGAAKVGVEQRRRRDEQLTAKRAHGAIVAAARYGQRREPRETQLSGTNAVSRASPRIAAR